MENNNLLLCFEIKRLNNLARRHFERMNAFMNAESELGRSAYAIGYVVSKKDAHLYLKDLAHDFRITRGTASSIITCLEQKGYVMRVTDDKDSRLKRIVPTDKALAFHASIEQSADKLEEKLLNGFTTVEREEFASFIKRAMANLEQQEVL